MKKLAAIACILSAAALFGCQKNEPETVQLPQNFTVTADITCDDFSAAADMTRREGGWDITVTAPETLEGMKISLTDADCTVSYRELSYTAANEDMPANSPIRLTAQSLDRCVQSKTSGTLNGADYEFTFEDGSPKSLEIGGQIEVKFSGYSAES